MRFAATISIVEAFVGGHKGVWGQSLQGFGRCEMARNPDGAIRILLRTMSLLERLRRDPELPKKVHRASVNGLATRRVEPVLEWVCAFR